MGFFSDLFNKKSKTPQPPQTRTDLENSLSVHYLHNMQINTTGGVLNQAFQQSRPPQEEEKKLIKDVLDLIASVPQGKKLVDDVAQMGFKFHFDAFHGSNDGCMYGSQKRIMLCPCQHSSIAALATTCFHEMTHAVQDEKSGNLLGDSSRLNIADQIKFQRAAEAAAWTEEAKFAYQIKDQHPEVLRHVGQFPMYKAFSEEMEKSGDMSKAGEAAFKTWYDYKHYQDMYEKQHIANISYYLTSRHSKGDNKALRETISSEETLQHAFISDDINKNISPEFLTQPKAFSISAEGIKELDKQVENYGYNLWKTKDDKSFHQMYSYESGQPYTAEANNKIPVAASIRPQQSIMSTLTKINTDQKIEKAVKTATQQKAKHR